MSKKISVVVPTFNEAGSIVSLLECIHSYLKDSDYETIVVDDNSPDGTFKVVSNCGNPHVRALLRTEDPGLAQSIRHGIENARGEYIVVMDSDFNHQPSHIPFMIQALSSYDCVFASRFLYGGRGASTRRHILSWSFNVFLRIITDGRVTDNLFGYFAVNRRVLSKLNYDDIFYGFGDYCIRLLYYIQTQRFTILQIPVVIGERMAGVGNRKIFRTFCQYLWTAICLVAKDGRIKLDRSEAKPLREAEYGS